MRTLLASLFIFALAGALWAQEDLEQKYKKKLQKEFATAISWEKTLKSAMKKATTEKKFIVGYFTRSYSQ